MFRNLKVSSAYHSSKKKKKGNGTRSFESTSANSSLEGKMAIDAECVPVPVCHGNESSNH